MKKLFFFNLIFFTIAFTVKAQWTVNGSDIYYDTGKVSINTPTPASPSDIFLTIKGSLITYGLGANQFFGGVNNTSEGWGEYGIEYNENAGGLNFWKPFGNSYNNAVKNWILFLKDDGRVGIGTKNLSKDFLLTVAGGIHAQEVLITSSAGGADFVFNKKYKLKNLPELEKYINTNKHLPDIPSAEKMKKDGLNIGDFQIKLLQKVEELTLYIIKQQKEIEALKAKLSKE